MEKLKILFNILLVTAVIRLAISYLTLIIPFPFKLNFLEAVGLYAIWTPIHHTFTNKDN